MVFKIIYLYIILYCFVLRHNQQEFYRAIAVKLNDELDEDGFSPAYEMKWNIIGDNPPCDWNNPIEIKENGFFQVLK